LTKEVTSDRITFDSSSKANFTKKAATICVTAFFWRRHPESNRGIKVLQTSALPLGYGAMSVNGHDYCRTRSGGADYGVRTRYLDLGKVALYQMS
jgi:hypothetical protein